MDKEKWHIIYVSTVVIDLVMSAKNRAGSLIFLIEWYYKSHRFACPMALQTERFIWRDMRDGWIGTSLPPLSKPFQNEMAPMTGDDGKPMGWTMVGSSPKEERRSRSIVKGGRGGWLLKGVSYCSKKNSLFFNHNRNKSLESCKKE